jgi:hypothetical protein
MYQAFDKFLATDTWHTTHPLDTKRFYQALDQVVRDDAFNADAMPMYIAPRAGARIRHRRSTDRARSNEENVRG